MSLHGIRFSWIILVAVLSGWIWLSDRLFAGAAPRATLAATAFVAAATAGPGRSRMFPGTAWHCAGRATPWGARGPGEPTATRRASPRPLPGTIGCRGRRPTAFSGQRMRTFYWTNATPLSAGQRYVVLLGGRQHSGGVGRGCAANLGGNYRLQGRPWSNRRPGGQI